MELLSQRKVHAMRQEEERQETKKALELADRVDSLRKLSLEEERSLSEQRDAMMAEFDREITAKKSVINDLATEVANLQEARKAALEPLTDLKSELELKGQELASQRLVADQERSQLAAREMEVQNQMDRASAQLDLITEMREQAEVLLRKRQLMIDEVTRQATALNSASEAFERHKASVESALSVREKRVTMLEREQAIARRKL